MTRNRAAWPVLFVADRSAERRISRSSTGIALSASSAQELVERVRLGDEADDRHEHEHERHRRQERVVGELARDPGDVVARPSAASCRPHATTSPDRAAHRRERRAPPGSALGRAPSRASAGERSRTAWVTTLRYRRVEGHTSPFGWPAGSLTIPAGGESRMFPGACFATRVVPLPPRGSSEARGTRAQRLGSPGHRSRGNVVERRDGPHSFPARPPERGIVARVRDRLRRRRADGLRNGAQPGRARATRCALYARSPARARDLPATPGARRRPRPSTAPTSRAPA